MEYRFEFRAMSYSLGGLQTLPFTDEEKKQLPQLVRPLKH
jgi:hypothetical protein